MAGKDIWLPGIVRLTQIISFTYLCLSSQQYYLIVKNLSLILNAVLLVAVAVLYYLHFSGNSGKTSAASVTPAKADTLAEANATMQQIAYVNSDSLLFNYDYYKTTIKELEEKRKKLETDISGRARSLENEAVSYQQKSRTMTLEQAQLTEQNLYRKQQELMQYRDRVSQQLAQEEQTKIEELYSNITEYLKEYTKDKPYRLVLGYSRGGGILFADNSLEITNEVLTGLNKQYNDKQPTPAAPVAPKK
jgi:outer membrane protein